MGSSDDVGSYEYKNHETPIPNFVVKAALSGFAGVPDEDVTSYVVILKGVRLSCGHNQVALITMDDDKPEILGMIEDAFKAITQGHSH